VYVVVSMVPGRDSSLRDVGFFVLRRKTAGGSAGADVTFTVDNARAQVGSFWVHGVDRRGYATVFAIRNILSTALGNWSRYIHVLQAAHALAAAAHPLITMLAPGLAAAPARRPTAGPWAGGQRPDGRVLAIYRLLMATIGNADSYGLVKKQPMVADFIASELGNPALAARWRQVVAQVPLKVPDQYAAGAQEERRFTRVFRPKISGALVAFSNTTNSSDLIQLDGVPFPVHLHTAITIHVTGTGSGVVGEQFFGTGPVNYCTLDCTYSYTTYGSADFKLTAAPDPGSVFSGWTGCTPDPHNVCDTWTTPLTATGQPSPPCCSVTATFTTSLSYPLGVTIASTVPGASGAVTSSPPGINCSSSCSASFPHGATVTLTPAPNPGSSFEYWTGCDSLSGDTCTVTMDQAKNVQANFV
jgi:Divergent InlB B-repeat domain